MEPRVFLRAAGLQAALVAALFLILAALFPRSFFRDYGALTGPIAWMACAVVCGRLLGLSAPRVLVAAAAAGAVAALTGTLLGHLAGLVVAVLAFGAACAARTSRIGGEPALGGRAR